MCVLHTIYIIYNLIKSNNKEEPTSSPSGFRLKTLGYLLKLSCVGGVLHLVRCGNYLIKPRPYLKIVLSRKIRRKEKEIKISVLTVLNLRDLLFSTALIFHSASKKWGLSDLDPTARLIISF